MDLSIIQPHESLSNHHLGDRFMNYHQQPATSSSLSLPSPNIARRSQFANEKAIDDGAKKLWSLWTETRSIVSPLRLIWLADWLHGYNGLVDRCRYHTTTYARTYCCCCCCQARLIVTLAARCACCDYLPGILYPKYVPEVCRKFLWCVFGFCFWRSTIQRVRNPFAWLDAKVETRQTRPDRASYVAG